MIEAFLIIIIFIIGIYFGSFYTLAIYRIPKGENITYKHSYCPKCNHKLGIFDLVPIFSYIFLKGKCRYCKNPIGIRYFLLEFLTGIVFVLFYLSLKIDLYYLNIETIIFLFISMLYFTYLFIIAGIEKEKNEINDKVLIFGGILQVIYIIYSYILKNSNAYEYVIYLTFMIVLLITNTFTLKKNLKYNYYIQIIILILNMLIFTGLYNMIFTAILTILSIGIKNIIIYFKHKKSVKVSKIKEKKPIAFYLSVSNIIIILAMNFLQNYLIK